MQMKPYQDMTDEELLEELDGPEDIHNTYTRELATRFKAKREELARKCVCEIENDKVIEYCKLHGEELTRLRQENERLTKELGLKRAAIVMEAVAAHLGEQSPHRYETVVTNGSVQGFGKAQLSVVILKENKQMKPKRYTLETVSDIADCVNYGNLDCFMTDLRSFLESHIALAHLARIGAEVLGRDLKGKRNSELVLIKKFIWIDDGKRNQKLAIDILSPPNAERLKENKQ
jgi:hypothetical protein